MARKTKNVKVSVSAPASEAAGQSDVARSFCLTLPILAAILLTTIIAYLPVFDAQKDFTNWDDNLYVVAQPLVTEFSVDSIGKMFSTSTEVASNYHPLTMLSLGLTKAVFGLSARAFVGVNLAFHVLNTALVFALVWMLTQRRLWASALTALWFGIHPMHVESVAWTSERKDVLYAFFLLLSLLAYVRYVTAGRPLMLGLALLAFIASCLSKAMAVPMAVALLLIDYWFDRKLSTRVVLEKVPFLLLALVFGWLAVSIQSKTAVADFGAITMPQRIAFAGYGFVMYWVKMFVPVNLVAFYPYPTLESNGQIASWYFLMPVVAVAIVVIPFIVVRRDDLGRRVVVFGMGLFILFVALVLQFMQVGMAIMADRYTYVPYIGSFFILAMAADWVVQRYGRAVGMGLAVVSLVLVPITYAQVDTWKNSETLWTNVMKHYPMRTEQSASGMRVVKRGVGLAYAARGDYFYEKGRFDEAFEDLKMAELAGHSGARYYLKLGVLYGQRGLREDALRVLNIASIQGPNNAETLYNRGITLAMMDRSKEAVADFEAILSLKAGPDTRESTLYALAQETRSLGRVDESLSWCDKLISEFPQNADGRLVKALILLDRGQTATAAQLLSESVQLDGTNDATWYRLAITRLNMGQKDQARTALAKARALGRQIDPSIEALVR